MRNSEGVEKQQILIPREGDFYRFGQGILSKTLEVCQIFMSTPLPDTPVRVKDGAGKISRIRMGVLIQMIEEGNGVLIGWKGIDRLQDKRVAA